jgi:cell wall assembly regulator SMI1
MTIEEALRSLAKDGDAPIRAENPPIDEIEKTLGATLDPISRSYLSFVPREPTGQWETPHWMQWSFWSGLTIRQMLEQRKNTLECFEDDFDEGIDPDRGVRAKWFHDKWLPIADNGGGDLLCIDLDPANGGRVGQIVEFRHADADRKRVARNLIEFLTHLEDEAPTAATQKLPILIARFFINGELRPAKVTVFRGENPEAVATGESPAHFVLVTGTYSVRFEFEGQTHWRRDVRVWTTKQEIDFHC